MIVARVVILVSISESVRNNGILNMLLSATFVCVSLSTAGSSDIDIQSELQSNVFELL